MSLTPTQKKKVRATISVYCAAAVANEPNVHYTRNRPFPYYLHIGTGYVRLDCSAFVGNVFWAAMHLTGIYLHDPLDQLYTGEGFTGTEEAFLRLHGSKVTDANGYLVGDLARWGTGLHAHTAVCSKAGTSTTAEWTSHGREAGPVVVNLHYRDDLIGAWRHPGLR